VPAAAYPQIPRTSLKFFYGSNLSLGREWLLDEPFDEEFTTAAWEDIELGYRLGRRGLKLIYERGAVAEHRHPTGIKRFMARQEEAGEAARIFHRLHPDVDFLGVSPQGPAAMGDPAVLRLKEGWIRLVQRLPLELPVWWEQVLRYRYLRGVWRWWGEAASSPSTASAITAHSRPKGR